MERRSLWARVGDTIAIHAGRMWLIAFHLVWFTVWLVMNVGPRPAFDPCRVEDWRGAPKNPVGMELGRASCRWRVTSPALSVAGWVHSSTMATIPEAPL